MSEPAREKIYGADPSEPNTRLLRVKIIRASELQRRDILGGPGDPYIKLSLQTTENRNQVIDIARTRTVPKTLNPVWNQEFLFRVDPTKHRILAEIFDQNRITKDEFLGMFFIEFNLNIPTEAAEQPYLVRDYPLLKRSVLQRVRGSASVGLCYVNQSTPSSSLPQSDSQNQENERTHDAGFEIINHRDAMEAAPEQPLPPGWEQRRDGTGRVYYVDHNNRTTTWVRPTGRGIASASRPQPQTSDRRQIDDMTNSTISRSGSLTNTATAAAGAAAATPGQRTSTNNLPADGLGQLPPGWQMSKNESGRVFFIDHINKRTTWIDPRTGKATVAPTAQHDSAENGPLPENWEARRLPDGRLYFIDHQNKTTTWTDPRVAGPPVPYSRDYERKYREFHRELVRTKPSTVTQIELHVNRKDIMETSFRAVMSVKDPEQLKARLWIVFDGEKGLDYGGVSREWFLLLSHEMFNPYYGLFEYSAIDNYTLQINALSGILNEEHMKYFRFIGRIIAMAIYHRKLLEAFFIRPFYKMLLSRHITLADMESVDREYYQSLKYILDNDPADLDLTFVVSEEVLGTLQEHELKPGGKDIPVTEQNKKEYIDSVINYRFIHRIKSQMDALRQGFRDIFPLDMIQVFDEKEVELLISGLGEINVEDWRTHTQYKGGYDPRDMVIQNFWKAIGSFNTEERTRFLQFVTGTSRVPMNGFRELWGSNGPQKFTIERWGDRKKLPRAHTCFNRLDLPPYENYNELRLKLVQAMEMSEAFDGVD